VFYNRLKPANYLIIDLPFTLRMYDNDVVNVFNGEDFIVFLYE